MLDPKVFKAYDVRGLYPTELDEEGAYAIGRAVVQQFEPKRFAVGRDMRLSSPAMAAVTSVPTNASDSADPSTERISSKLALSPPSKRMRASAMTPIVRARR